MDSGGREADDFARARLGTVLRGKYRLDQILGQGGMATVYRATHRNQAEFAVKILHPELSRDADIRGRFLREGYAANSVKHPCVVRVVDDDIAEDGAAFLVMELLEDGASCDVISAKRASAFSAEVASAIVLQTLEVLSAAHEKGILHRDIKPANLFVTRTGIVKVLDFGIARARDAISGHHTTTGVLLGTPAFMSPEQALAKTRDMDGRTDLWAVAATYFILVSGRPVHEAETNAELAVMAATQRARPLRSVAPKVPPEMCKIIDRGLAFDRNARWPDANAMRSALLAAHRSQFGEASHRCVASLFEATPTIRLGGASASPPRPASDAPSTASLQPPETTTAQPLSRVAPRSTVPPRWVVAAVVGAGCLLLLMGAMILRREPVTAAGAIPVQLATQVPAPIAPEGSAVVPTAMDASSANLPSPVTAQGDPTPATTARGDQRAVNRRSVAARSEAIDAGVSPQALSDRRKGSATREPEDRDAVIAGAVASATASASASVPLSAPTVSQPPPATPRPCVVPTMSACLWKQVSICIEACKEYNGKSLDECTNGQCLQSDPSNEANWIPLCQHEIEAAQKGCGR